MTPHDDHPGNLIRDRFHSTWGALRIKSEPLEIQPPLTPRPPLNTQDIIKQLENYPSESLVKILARLFDKITSFNDHSNPSTPPATPSSQLSQPVVHSNNPPSSAFEHLHLLHQSCLPQNSTVRPAQSPTVLRFQHLDFPHQLDHLTSDPDTRTRYSSVSASSSSSTSPSSSSSSSSPSSSTSSSSSDGLNNHQSRTHKIQQPLAVQADQLTTASQKILSDPSSILTFHAKTPPPISVEAYLLRILKYCPTPNGVFLSSLIYLDRLSKISFFREKDQLPSPQNSVASPPLRQTRSSDPHPPSTSASTPPPTTTTPTFDDDNHHHHHTAPPQQPGVHFSVDSWNIHRFLLASITVASKLFSDVFYTNARYAKVGGLPLKELEELEIKFLLMSDFRLMIRTEEFESYGTKLLWEDFAAAEPPLLRSTRETIGGKVPTGIREEKAEEEEGVMDVHGVQSSNAAGFEWDGMEDALAQRNQEVDEHDRATEDPSALHRPITPNPSTWRSSFSHAVLSSSSSSSSSCNSSERSSCSTVTPYSPGPVIAAFNPPIPASTTA